MDASKELVGIVRLEKTGQRGEVFRFAEPTVCSICHKKITAHSRCFVPSASSITIQVDIPGCPAPILQPICGKCLKSPILWMFRYKAGLELHKGDGLISPISQVRMNVLRVTSKEVDVQRIDTQEIFTGWKLARDTSTKSDGRCSIPFWSVERKEEKL